MFLTENFDISSAIFQILTFHGVGPQLYFLPYLLLIWMLWAVISVIVRDGKFWVIIILFSFLLCQKFPILGSTGSNIRLLPFYFFGFGVGVLMGSKMKQLGFIPVLLIALSLLAGCFDARFSDFGLVLCLLLLARSLDYSGFLSGKSFPGSGGIYLLHTPVTNYAFVTLFLLCGIKGLPNLLFSVLFTYVFCLFSSCFIIKYFPRFKIYILE